MLKSTEGPLGPYELKIFADRMDPSIPTAGKPYQGGIIDTPNGDWYYLAFENAYPGGRVPTLSPFTLDADGWPVLPSNNSFATPNEYPVTHVPVEPYDRTQMFRGPSLTPQWEWNHNPDTSAISFDRVNKKQLLKRMVQAGIVGNIIRWADSFLSNRRALLVVDGRIGKTRGIRTGLP
jgi:beta-xylosidase